MEEWKKRQILAVMPLIFYVVIMSFIIIFLGRSVRYDEVEGFVLYYPPIHPPDKLQVNDYLFLVGN